MSISLGSFIVTLILSQKLRKYCSKHELPNLQRLYWICTAASIAFFILEAVFHTSKFTQWVWHIFTLSLIGFSLQQPPLRLMRGIIFAFVPYVIVAVIGDFTAAVANSFFKKWEYIFDYALMFAYIWMGIVLFTQDKQLRSSEREKEKRKQEDELNKATAIRKEELEKMVAERTSELTSQKEALEQTLTELQETQKQLIQSEKMASLGELTAGIAHEIQNPLNFVNNFSELNSELIGEMNEALDNGDIEEAKQIAKDINDNEQKIIFHGKRADGIVRGMLQHSRSSSGAKELVDINVLADEYLRLSYHGLRAKNKSFNAKTQTDLDTTLGKINIVPQDIGRVILNLLNNAFYAVTEKKENSQNANFEPGVTVATKNLGNQVEITISDNGNGIPPQVLEKIFQPFFTTKPTGLGTGLGLSLSYDIITKTHGGTLQVRTKEGEGTSFVINLPIQ